MGNNIKSDTTFWTEINNYKIQVPYYQRDYAQGRTDGGRIDNIRKVFVEELYQAINGERLCHLGLVFGSYDNDSSTFIAVDGQQRLTTVFLLHWYVAWRENKLNDYKELSTNFSWDTRSYSSQFVELLFKINQSESIINAITTNCNYFSIWENDPTVKGMLTMLEEIERQYPKEGCLCQKLFSNDCSIRYDILKLEKDSDGKTYLKMNSRGRSLTTFELFKSKFIDEFKPNFANKFDKEWMAFMLQMSKTAEGKFGEPDFSFMNFINEYTYIQLKLNDPDKEDKSDYKEFVNAKIKGNLTDIPFISFEKYQKAFVNKLDSFERFFDWIISNYNKIKSIDDEYRFKESRFFIDAIIKDKNPNYSHRTKLYAAFKFAELSKFELLNETLYKRWSRVFINLVANSGIDDDNFSRICKAINQINNVDIYSYLDCGGKLSTFEEEQVKEEITKAKQIVTGGDEWETKIIAAEKYAFFKGAIRFLYTKDSIGDDWKHFDTKWKNAQEYFDENGVKDEEVPDKQYKTNSLLMKSLLANCNDFWSKIWWHFEFSNDSTRWRRILIAAHWRNAVDAIMSTEITKEITENYVKNVQDKFIKNIVDDNLMDFICNNMSGAWIRRTYHDYQAVWISGYPANQIVLNPILAQLKCDRKIEYRDINKIENCRYYKCVNKNVDFKYKSHDKYYYFNWWGNPNDKELDVYLTEDNWPDYKYKKQPDPNTDKTNEDSYYCFRVTKEMEENTALFTNELESLIAQAGTNDSEKEICKTCQEKICEQTE